MPALRRAAVAPVISIPSCSMSTSSLTISPTMRPFEITTIRCDRSRISSSSVEISSTPTPLWAAARTWLDRYSIAPTSSPRVGWAATSTRGSWESSRAITTRCWLPPDRDHIGADGPVQLMSNRSIRVDVRRSISA